MLLYCQEHVKNRFIEIQMMSPHDSIGSGCSELPVCTFAWYLPQLQSKVSAFYTSDCFCRESEGPTSNHRKLPTNQSCQNVFQQTKKTWITTNTTFHSFYYLYKLYTIGIFGVSSFDFDTVYIYIPRYYKIIPLLVFLFAAPLFLLTRGL